VSITKGKIPETARLHAQYDSPADCSCGRSRSLEENMSGFLTRSLHLPQPGMEELWTQTISASACCIKSP